MKEHTLWEMPYYSGEIYKILVLDKPMETQKGLISEFIGVENTFNGVRGIAYIMNDTVYMIPMSNLEGLPAFKMLGEKDSPLMITVYRKRITDCSVDIGDEYKGLIQRIIDNHSEASYYVE